MTVIFDCRVKKAQHHVAAPTMEKAARYLFTLYPGASRAFLNGFEVINTWGGWKKVYSARCEIPLPIPLLPFMCEITAEIRDKPILGSNHAP